jgi:hypothetical protein
LRLGVSGKHSAKGSLGDVILAGLLSKAGGQQRVGRGFRRELQRFKQVIGGLRGVVSRAGLRAIDFGEGSPGASLECGTCLAGVELGCGNKLWTGFVLLALPGQQQAKREMSLKGFWIGGCGAASSSRFCASATYPASNSARASCG